MTVQPQRNREQAQQTLNGEVYRSTTTSVPDGRWSAPFHVRPHRLPTRDQEIGEGRQLVGRGSLGHSRSELQKYETGSLFVAMAKVPRVLREPA